MLANLHILTGKTLAISIHLLQGCQRLVIERDRVLQIAEPEVVVGEIAVDFKRKDRIGDGAGSF